MEQVAYFVPVVEATEASYSRWNSVKLKAIGAGAIINVASGPTVTLTTPKNHITNAVEWTGRVLGKQTLTATHSSRADLSQHPARINPLDSMEDIVDWSAQYNRLFSALERHRALSQPIGEINQTLGTNTDTKATKAEE